MKKREELVFFADFNDEDDALHREFLQCTC